MKMPQSLRVLMAGLPITMGLSVQSSAAATEPTISPKVDHAAQLIPFDAPGSATSVSPLCGSQCGTLAYANSDEGTVVGSYSDDYLVPHGFLRTSDGQVAAFDAPGGATTVYSIDLWGVTTGNFSDANLVNHGFVWRPAAP